MGGIQTDPGMMDIVPEIELGNDIYHKPIFKLLKGFKLQ
jgi:hypothetical protein